MMSEREIWAAALLLFRRLGHDARSSAAMRADEMLAFGDMESAVEWRRIMAAIERLQAKAPPDGVAVH